MSETLVRCPVCETRDFLPDAVDPTTGMVTCECGHQADAAFLSEAVYLEARLAWVRDRIRAGDRAADASSAGLPVPGLSAAAVPPGGGPSAQTLLLSVGALLLVVAASVFTAVAWPRLGPAGQLALIVVATVAVTALALRIRHRLPGTAEALAALAVGLALVVLVALPMLGVAPEQWREIDSPYWLVAFAALAVAGVVGGRASGLRSWSWLGWASAAMATGVASALVGGPEPVNGPRLVLALVTVGVSGVLLVAGSWVVDGLAPDRRPMSMAGSVTLMVSVALVAALAFDGEAAVATATSMAVVAGVLGALARIAGPASPLAFGWGAVLLAVASAGLLMTLLPVMAPVGLLVAALGAAMVIAGVRLRTSLIGLPAALVLWLTWLSVQVSDTSVWQPIPDGFTWFVLGVAASLLAAAWLGNGRSAITWLAWPGAVAAMVGFALLAPEDYPVVLEAWTLPAALLLAVAGWVSCRGRPASSLESAGPALSVALLPSAAATWLAPWVLDTQDDPGQHLIRLGLVLAVGAVAMVLGVHQHWLGVLLPASAAVLLATLAQVWTGLDALPRWAALAIAGTLLVLAGARFEWLRGEGRKARTWVRQLD